MIIAGELEPGARLRQVEIAEHFGVSTTPVREAFASLAQEGFVRQDAHRGVEVFRPSVADIRENYEIRLALEPMATRLAAARATDEDLAHIDALRLEMEGTEQFEMASGLNREFHFAIYRAGRNAEMLELIERFRRAADAYVRLLLPQAPRGYAKSVVREHRAIAKALRSRDGDAAFAATERHLEHNLEQISKLVLELD